MTDDAAWFEQHPHRAFRCRLLKPCEREAKDTPPAGSTAVRVIYVRKSDGAGVKAWTCHPDFLIAEEDESRARFAAQGMPNPPAFDEAIARVETIPASLEMAAYLDGVLGKISNEERR